MHTAFSARSTPELPLEIQLVCLASQMVLENGGVQRSAAQTCSAVAEEINAHHADLTAHLCGSVADSG